MYDIASTPNILVMSEFFLLNWANEWSAEEFWFISACYQLIQTRTNKEVWMWAHVIFASGAQYG